MLTPADARLLLAAIASGDLVAFERLVLAYQDRLFNFALRLSGNAEDAEEIVQDAFVKAYRAFSKEAPATPRADFALTPWLFKIVLNTARNRYRRRRPATIPIDGREGDTPPALWAPQPEQPEQHALSSERHALVAQALLCLPLSCRAVVLLRYVEGLSYEEIATTLGQPLGTVKSSLFRGSRRLRSALAGALDLMNASPMPQHGPSEVGAGVYAGRRRPPRPADRATDAADIVRGSTRSDHHGHH